jgi:hypothetical protein
LNYNVKAVIGILSDINDNLIPKLSDSNGNLINNELKQNNLL